MPPKETGHRMGTLYLGDGVTFGPIVDLTDDLTADSDKPHNRLRDVFSTDDVGFSFTVSWDCVDKLMLRIVFGLPVTNNWRRMHGYPVLRKRKVIKLRKPRKPRKPR